MIIVVEGSNRVGKSTIIKKLAKMHNVSTIYNRDIRSEMKDCEQEGYISALAMLDALEATSDSANVILDRFHLSEFVYGLKYRSYLSERMLSVIDKRLADMGALLILVTSDYKHLQNESEDKIQEYMSIQELFKDAYTGSRMNKIQIRLEEVN